MLSRRSFLKAVCTGIFLFPVKRGEAFVKPERVLNMYNTHTGETLSVRYFSSGTYDPDALKEINYFLRCHHTNKITDIDTGVLDLLCDIKCSLHGSGKIQIISGYRSPMYNNLLVSLGRNVSKKSLHLQGRAIDFTIDGVSPADLARTARSFYAGGVGEYPGFVHIDVGRVRYW